METQRSLSTEAAARSRPTDGWAVFDALGDAVLIHDAATGEILEVNRKLCDLCGYSPEEARRLNIRDILGDGSIPLETAPDGPDDLIEWQVRDRAGGLFWVEARLNRTVIAGREQVCAVLRDINGRKDSAAPGEQEESFYRLVTEDSLAGAYIIQDGKFLFVNASLAQTFGYSAAELLSGRVAPEDLVHPDDLPLVKEKFRQRLREEMESLRYTFRGRRRDGTEIHCEVLSNRVLYRGRPTVVGTLVDITARKRAEEALRETSNTLQALITATPLAIMAVDRDFRVQLWNPAAERIFGWPQAEVLGRPLAFIPEDQVPETLARIRQSMQGQPQSALELRRLRRDGSMIDVSLWTVPLRNARGEIMGDMGIIADISSHKQMEAALQTSEANYCTIFNAVDDGIAVVDLETGNFIDVNQKWSQMTGFSPEEARGLNVATLCLDEPPFTGADAMRWIREASQEKTQVFEYLAKTKEGRRHWVEINLRRTLIGGRERLLAVIRDITERKLAEEALRASEAKYRNLVEQIPVITYIAALDDVSSPIYISPQCEAILGFTPEEFLADPEAFKNRIHPEDRDRVLTESLLSYAKGGPFAAEYRMLSKTGRVVWIRDESRAVYDSEGQPLFLQGVAVDITARKKTEEALREANNKLRALVQASPLAIVGLDTQGKVMSWNPAAERIFGWRASEVVGRPQPLVLGGERREYRHLWQRVLAGEPLLGLELRHRSKEGSRMDLSLSTAPLYDAAGQFAGAMGVFEDITARKRTEEALRESEARFRAMFEGAPIGMALVDLQRTVLEANPALGEMGGYEEGELLQTRSLDFTHPDDWEADLALFTELVAGKRNRYQIEKRYRHKQGHWFWVRLSVSLVRDAAGQPQFAISMVEDITERKRAQEAAEEIRRQQEAILNNIPDIAWLKDRESRLIAVNEQYCRACGLAPGELAGKLDADIWPPEMAAKYRADDLEVMTTGKQFRLEETMRDRKGQVHWVETVKTPIFNEFQEVIGTAGIARDITARRRMEDTLRKVSRAHKAVTECDQALLRATNEAELLSEVCRIIVEVGGYRMAWVGFAQQDTEKGVRPMAQEGVDEGYVQALRITWGENEAWGQGPVGTAIRTGEPAISRDTRTDPGFSPAREAALQRGFASVLALPLGDHQPFGALAIYATEPNAFDEEEINLLFGLANDLTYGIKALRTGAERQRAEEALRQSEKKYRSLMNGASDGIVLADPEGTIAEVNRRAEELLGYSEEELLGLQYTQIHPPEKLSHVLENYEEVIKTGSGRLHECVVLRKDGRTVPVDITHIVVEYGDQRVVQAIFRDITERQRAEEALRDSEQKLRLLASQLLTVQEKERRRVSRELHDELGQALTVLKIHLVAIENKLRRDQHALKVSCEHLLNDIDAVIENVRRLSWDLSPSILEDLGLSSSLKYLIAEICRDNQMLYEVTMDEIDNLFSSETKINIYRIFQESLTNIVRHADASRIDVKIKRREGRVTFALRDNGKGFALKEARSRHLGKRGLGLTTMNERALMTGGTLSFWSQKGKGTSITLSIPIQPEG